MQEVWKFHKIKKGLKPFFHLFQKIVYFKAAFTLGMIWFP